MKKKLRAYQKLAINKVKTYFKKKDRGKMIMACGTGKTFTSLKIAEKLFGKNHVILCFVPSLSLLSQTEKEWKQHVNLEMVSLSISSDHSISTKMDPKNLFLFYQKIQKKDQKMIVIFSTYQSIDVIIKSQKEYPFPIFDLIICDEAHRTTGISLTQHNESRFKKVHYNKNIRAKKRLYMTATPKIYKKKGKTIGKEKDVILTSMNNKLLYGKTIYRLKFNEAVKMGILTDYKVVVIGIEKEEVDRKLRAYMHEQGIKDLTLEDMSKMIAVYQILKEKNLKRTICFSSTIKKSKRISEGWQKTIERYGDSNTLEVRHIEGKDQNKERKKKMDWLKNPIETKRILSNVRCLTEGIDIPELDSIVFFESRKSIVDIIQGVGRVMRKGQEKKGSYIILPIVLEAGENDKNTKVVSLVLNALRSHDERIDRMLNGFYLGEKSHPLMEVILKTENNRDLDFNIPSSSEIEIEIEARLLKNMVSSVGYRLYWEEWAKNLEEIGKTYRLRLEGLFLPHDAIFRNLFLTFLQTMRNEINKNLEEKELLEMIAQHMMTKPVFDRIFPDFESRSKNKISKGIEDIQEKIKGSNLERETEKLEGFYNKIGLRVKALKGIEAKQKLILELYDKFFRNAFPRLSESLGIVYTPIEVVDFIIHSIEEILEKEFSTRLGSKGVDIFDPFTGTGSFITRILQSGLIRKEEMRYKYENEIFANEIMLLAYYVGSINIEQVYHDLMGGEYNLFQGIDLCDTFERYNKIGIEGRDRMKGNLKVILSNPPYSRRQRNENDNNRNRKYEGIDRKIKETYMKSATIITRNQLYDSYIRALRVSTDLLGEEGIIGFISNNGYIEKPVMDGVRRCLEKDFTSIYILNLRGDIRKKILSGEKKEGENIFGMNSMNGNAITFFVRNKRALGDCKVYYYDIGEDRSCEDKKEFLRRMGSIRGMAFEELKGNDRKDWIGQRDEDFFQYILIGSKRAKKEVVMFETYSIGVLTGRDAWCCNSSKRKLGRNVRKMIDFYNEERKKYQAIGGEVKDVVNKNKSKIKWTLDLYRGIKGNKEISYEEENIVLCYYRPYTKKWLYYDKKDMLTRSPGKWGTIFPKGKENVVIGITGLGSQSGFSVLVMDAIGELLVLQGVQCFPLRVYKRKGDSYEIRDGITEEGRKYFVYNGCLMGKEDIFYYMYGMMSSLWYKERYKNNLDKELPRIPRVKREEDFWEYSEAGRELARLHLGYEEEEKYPVKVTIEGDGGDYFVKKMRFWKEGKKKDKSKIIYNDKILIEGIPLEAYEYKVNGKSAIEWVVLRQGIRKHKDSGIVNDGNDYGIETVGDKRYVLDLIQKVIMVSIKTMKIVKGLKEVEMDRVIGKEKKGP